MNATAKMSGNLADEIVMLEAVTDFPLFMRWAAEQERFAKAIPEGHPARNAALVMLDHIGDAIVRAGALNQSGDWRDDRVNLLMLDTMAKRAEAEHWCKLMAEGRTSKTQSENARKLRHPVTKAQLIASRDKYTEKNKGKTRGWITAACLEFHIDPATLNDRLKRK